MNSLNPLVKKYFLKLPHPSADDTAADLERLTRALDGLGVEGLELPLSVVRKIPHALRTSQYGVTATVGFGDATRLIDVQPGDTNGKNYGLAVDLGTTNVVGILLDLNTGAELAEASETNPQVAFGEDILTRMHHCLDEGGLGELQAMAAGCINGLAGRLAEEAGADALDIGCVSVSGNTTMAHLFLGLDPYNIPRAPYVPVAGEFGFFTAGELGLAINPEGLVYVLPDVGSYVGGDVLAGVLVSGMHEKAEVSLLVDIGTNAEIVVGNRDWLVVCAGAAGPALEGGVVKSGMRAMPGAIERIKVDPKTHEPSYSVIGGEKPRGLCGSALIDLLAGLFAAGLIDGKGRFVEHGKTSPRVVEHEGRKAYVVVPAGEAAQGVDILFTETDMDNLIRTKAAMYTALCVVTRDLGVEFGQLSDFFIAGTFGAYIAPDKALAIGMVPDIGLGKYKPIGNTSLKGACRVLATRGAVGEIRRIASTITYKELNVSADFMSEFRAAMFLPHTDSSLFPSLK